MTILTIILGILMILCGISCTFTPLLTFLQTGYFLLILLLVYGIGGIIRGVAEKRYGVNFVFAIISVIAGLLIAFIPGLKLMTDGMLLYMMAGWFIIQGVITLRIAFITKKLVEGSRWIWQLILGILGIILGIYSCIHPAVLAVTIGILIGVYFMVTGINMIVLAGTQNS